MESYPIFPITILYHACQQYIMNKEKNRRILYCVCYWGDGEEGKNDSRKEISHISS